MGLGIPRFEFVRASGAINENKIFVCDPYQAWYQRGITAELNSVRTLASFLSQRIEDIRPERVVMIGNSMGGFAALLFGCILKVDKAIAFSPQISVSPSKRLEFLDFRWPRQILNMYLTTLYRDHCYDLRPVLLAADKTTFEIHVADDAVLV